MLAVRPFATVELVNRIARSMLAFVGAYGREEEMIAHGESHPTTYHPPGPTRPSSIIACVPAYVQQSGDAIAGGISSRSAAGMTTGGHLDGEGVDIDAVSQPGADVSDLELEAAVPAGAVRCVSPPWIGDSSAIDSIFRCVPWRIPTPASDQDPRPVAGQDGVLSSWLYRIKSSGLSFGRGGTHQGEVFAKCP
jgi:hypothetical protein